VKKLIIFDLDGVLIDTKDTHYVALNKALMEAGESYVITESEHISTYDGLSTNEKLKMLSERKDLPTSKHQAIWESKQRSTNKELNKVSQNEKLIKIFEYLEKENFLIACCSNSIRKTVYKILSNLNIISYFDYLVSNGDVKNAKPHPEMYWKAMSALKVTPEETIIVEDSPTGLLAAERSGAKVCRVKDSLDLTLSKIINFMSTEEKVSPKWKDENLNVLIPMAGAGSRFEKAGYAFPKPLIEVNGKPMIQVVVDNLSIEANYIFIVQKSHKEKYNLDSVLNLIAPNCKIVEVDGMTEGAACTTLLAEEYINNDRPLLLANSDQFVEWSSSKFLYKMQEQDLDGGILSFSSTHPKWSYAKVDENGHVTEVAEKKPISNCATVGIYYWKKGSDYVKYAKQMIQKDTRTNNEFYVCPVFNEAVGDNKRVAVFGIEKMWGLGTPEDLRYFLTNYKK
jgi:HAD superfamily hydrolase (TIGR01509 family)